MLGDTRGLALSYDKIMAKQTKQRLAKLDRSYEQTMESSFGSDE